jgi:hypothetical protein
MPVDVVKVAEKPKILRAVQFLGVENGQGVALWCGGFYDEGADRISINSDNVTQVVCPGGWIVKRPETALRFFVYTKERFEDEYQEVVIGRQELEYSSG